jgi:molybdenum ABC transporter molybdate-binding protein
MSFRSSSRLLIGFLLLFGGLMAHASTPAPIPAKPLDPDQAIPAQPVIPTPAQPSAPATAADTNTTTPVPTISLTVLADSTLRNVLQELAQTWADSQASSPQVPLTLTNAGTMRNQVQSNPAWDVVISADLDDVKMLTDKGLLVAAGQHTLARNTLVIYGRKALVKDDALDWFDLIGTEWKKVAMGDPDQVSSGRVARRALQKHDLFDDDHKNLYVYTGTEALALQVVERDQADAVFVYKTDLATIDLPGFEIFPLSTVDAPPIFYTAATGRLSKNTELAQAFIAYCGSEAVRQIWAKYGFEMN